MTQWKSVPEPYIKVQERVIDEVNTPTAGEELIIGVPLITDAGSSTPTLIQSQTEFLNTFASQKLSSDYIKSIDSLYSTPGIAGDMWLNAYRLAGSTNLLVVRATKGDDVHYSLPISVTPSNGTFIIKDGQMLKKMEAANGIKLVIDSGGEDASSPQTSSGWAMAVNGIGVVGNLTTDDGPQYDYFVNSLPDLVKFLNESNMFFAPKVEYYKTAKVGNDTLLSVDNASSAKAVVFKELYLGSDFLDKDESRVVNAQTSQNETQKGLAYLIFCSKDWASSSDSSMLIDINGLNLSGFTETNQYYATNTYNSHSDIKVRIRRFNHDAVISKDLDTPDANKNGKSPYTVLTDVTKLYSSDTNAESRDFFEFAILDPSVSSDVLYYNVGNISGRGDMTIDELNDAVNMVDFTLPDDLHDLGLNYYDPDSTTPATNEIVLNLDVDPEKTELLSVDVEDLKAAADKIEENDVYIVEGLSDLGCTEPSYQNYLANMAANHNYFYSISTINSSNYLAIANSASKISGGVNARRRLYLSAPWDSDTETVGFKFYTSPSVMYWEAVSRNRSLGKEFADVFGQNNGTVNYQDPVCQFNKKTRELLLSKKINTVKWNSNASQWEMNDSFTLDDNQSNTIMSSDGNSRLAIRISKNVGETVKQFIGEKINSSLFANAEEVIKNWMKLNILPLPYGIDDFQVTINDEDINPISLQRQNKMRILIEVRYQKTLKYTTVVDQIYDVGQDFTGTIRG